MTFPIFASLLVRLVVLLPFQLLRLSLATPSRWPPLARYAFEVPEELERIVEKAFTKDVDERYQSAKDMLIDLRHLKRKLEVDAEIDRTVPPEIRAAAATHSHPGAATVSGAPPTGPAMAARSQSSAEYIIGEIKQHRKSFAAAAAGAVVVVVVAVFSISYFVRRTPALTAKDTILLSDFVNTTGDGVFERTLKQGPAVTL